MRILVIQNSWRKRAILVELMRTYFDHDVCIANGLSETLDFIINNPPDLIISDAEFRDGSPTDLLDFLNGKFSPVPIVLFSKETIEVGNRMGVVGSFNHDDHVGLINFLLPVLKKSLV